MRVGSSIFVLFNNLYLLNNLFLQFQFSRVAAAMGGLERGGLLG